jgi:hypothetical protein
MNTTPDSPAPAPTKLQIDLIKYPQELVNVFEEKFIHEAVEKVLVPAASIRYKIKDIVFSVREKKYFVTFERSKESLDIENLEKLEVLHGLAPAKVEAAPAPTKVEAQDVKPKKAKNTDVVITEVN